MERMSSTRRSMPATIVAIAVIAIAYGLCCLQGGGRPGDDFPPMSRAEFDARPLRELGYSPETIRSLIVGWTSGPWMEIDGDGGRVDLDGDKLVLFSTTRNHTECRQV